MSNDFDLERSRWYNLMKVGLACRSTKTDAETIIKRSRNLGKFEYEPTAGKELADAENALTEALFAVQVARAEYERITNQFSTILAAE